MFDLHYTQFLADAGYLKIEFRAPVLPSGGMGIKSRVSNRSDSKKSDSGRNSNKSDSGTQKVRYYVGYHALFTPNFMFCFIRSGSGSVRYIPDLENSGSGSPKKVGFRSGTRKFWYPLHH